MAKEKATLAGGCFWCLEAVYELVRGVAMVESGYIGGSVVKPTYEQVCGGMTGHAEAVQLTFDSDVVSYKELVEVFFGIHDPSTLNRQGPDVGTQYRSAIYFHSEEQRRAAERVVAEISAKRIWSAPIVTEIEPLSDFYPAEKYHREYFRRNRGQAYCQFLIEPKVAKFRKDHLALLSN